MQPTGSVVDCTVNMQHNIPADYRLASGEHHFVSCLQEADQNDDAEEDLTVTHRKHLRFFGIRWRYWRMSIAVLISVLFAVAGILLHNKARGLVSLAYEQQSPLMGSMRFLSCSLPMSS